MAGSAEGLRVAQDDWRKQKQIPFGNDKEDEKQIPGLAGMTEEGQMQIPPLRCGMTKGKVGPCA